MARVETDRGPIEAAMFGPADAPPVLLIAGGGGAMWSWARLLPESWPPRLGPVEAVAPIASLATTHRVAVFDQAGVGASTGTPPARSVDASATDALAVATSLLGSRFAVVGLSLGGTAALRLALREPARVAALVLGCTVANASEFVPSAVSHGGAEDDVETQLRAAFEASFADRFPAVIDAFVAATLALPRHADIDRAMVDQFLSNDGNDLGRVGAKTVVLCGDRDRVFPLANSRRLADSIPGAELRVLPGVGHAVHIEAPDALLTVTRQAAAE